MAAYISFQPSDLYTTHTYAGSSSAPNAQTIGFQPDFVWTKPTDLADPGRLVNSARGGDYTQKSSSDQAEQSGWTPGAAISAWDSTGYTIGTTDGGFNSSSWNYVAWCWKAGTTTGIAGSPTITPTAYSFNQTAGFSVVTYTANNTAGATIPHGLGAAPDVALFKCTSYAENWNMYNKNLTGGTAATYTIRLNHGTAEATTDNYNDTAQTSTTLFTLGNSGEINEGTRAYVGYFFKEKRGYSKFGKYVGNGNADGTFIYTGFRPAFVMIKATFGEVWNIWDNKRNTPSLKTGNENYTVLQPNNDNINQVGGAQAIDMLANGFKTYDSSDELNKSANNYIFIAFAEFPLVSSNSKAGTAR